MQAGTFNPAARGAPGGPKEPQRMKTAVLEHSVHRFQGGRLPACRMAPLTSQPREPPEGRGSHGGRKCSKRTFFYHSAHGFHGFKGVEAPGMQAGTLNPAAQGTPTGPRTNLGEHEHQAGPQRGPRTPTGSLNLQPRGTSGWAPAQRGPRTPTDRLNHQFWGTPGWAPARA